MSEFVASESSLVGRTVEGRYRLEERLGSGVQGATYRARHVEHQRVVALKLLHERVSGSSARRASFEWEVSTLSGLAHPNIATLVDYGVYEGQPWLAAEWLEGETLAARLQRGSLPLTAALAIVRQLLAALASAHGVRLIHKNLKPANVFLERSPTQSRERVKLLDFTPLLHAGACAGSPYAPPELAAGETLDARGDVFAVGVMLISMLNTTAFEPGAQADVSVSARARALPGVDATLLTWIRSATSPHRPLRFADAAAALRELIDLLPRDLLSPPARAEATTRTAAMAASRAPQPPTARPYIIAPPPLPGPARARAFTVPPPPPEPGDLEKPAPALSQLLQRASAPESATQPDPEPPREVESRADSRRGTLRPIESRIMAVASEPRRLQLMAAAVLGVFLVSALVILFQPGTNTRAGASQPARAVERETVATVRSLDPAPAKPPVKVPAPAPAAPAPALAPAKPSLKPPAAAVVAPAVSVAQPPAKFASARPDSRGLAIIAAPGRPPVRDPWQAAAPPELKRAHMLALNGAPGDEARIKALREYNRDHPEDARGYLVIGQLYLNRLWRTDCVEEWTTALERDPTARGAPEILPALIGMIEQGKAPILAERLLMKAYGSEALDPIDLAFEDVKNPTNAARLHALRLRITEGKQR
jgi:eukaryotic-like serine/threonine-protein kinase